MQTYWINRELGWKVKEVLGGDGNCWELYNQFGYVGSFASLCLALAADRRMRCE